MTDIQKVQSLIHGILLGITDLESGHAKFQTIKTKYQNASPDLTGSNMSSQQVTDALALITDVAAVLSNHAAIITTLKSKYIPSHRGVALD